MPRHICPDCLYFIVHGNEKTDCEFNYTKRMQVSDDQVQTQTARRPRGAKGVKDARKASRQLVRIMAAEGLPHERIAAALNISIDRLQKRYRRELTTTKDLLNAEVIARLFETATKSKERDAFRAQEFWVRCNAGWHEYSAKSWHPSSQAPAPRKVAAAVANEVKPEKLGKKEQANVDAQEVPQEGGWAGLVH